MTSKAQQSLLVQAFENSCRLPYLHSLFLMLRKKTIAVKAEAHCQDSLWGQSWSEHTTNDISSSASLQLLYGMSGFPDLYPSSVADHSSKSNRRSSDGARPLTARFAFGFPSGLLDSFFLLSSVRSLRPEILSARTWQCSRKVLAFLCATSLSSCLITTLV